MTRTIATVLLALLVGCASAPESLTATTADSDVLARSLGEKAEALATARVRLADAVRDLTLE